MDQFARTRLLFGSDAPSILAHKHVAVFGIGGVGGHAAEALVRTGVGHIDIIDYDTVDISNINRQIIATHSTIGQLKVDIMEQRLLDINPRCHITKHACFYLPETANRFNLQDYDYIIDAVDTITAKIHLIMQAREARVPLISAMGAGNKIDPTAIRIADIYETSTCPLARIMRKELRKRGVEALKVAYSLEAPLKPILSSNSHDVASDSSPSNSSRSTPGSNAFVPAAMGLALAAEVIKDLLKQ